MKIQIKRARQTDVLEILNLELRVWEIGFGLKGVAGKYDLGSFIRFGKVFVAKQGNKIIGAIIAFSTCDGCIFLVDWVVNKRHRGLGIGKRLYVRLVESIKGKKLISFVEERYTESISAHKSMGFKIRMKLKDVYGIGEKENYYVFVKQF
jgi:L-amino acid N-acyltransferase YncA